MRRGSCQSPPARRRGVGKPGVRNQRAAAYALASALTNGRYYTSQNSVVFVRSLCRQMRERSSRVGGRDGLSGGTLRLRWLRLCWRALYCAPGRGLANISLSREWLANGRNGRGVAYAAAMLVEGEGGGGGDAEGLKGGLYVEISCDF